MKTNILEWLKVILVLILTACMIIPNIGIWNVRTVPEAQGIVTGFITFWSVINFLAEGVAIYFFSRKVLFNSEKKKPNDNE